MSNKPRKLDCDEAVRLLFQFIDNELDGQDHAAMEAHLHDCRGCFSRMEFDRRLKGMVRDSETATAPDTLRQRLGKVITKF